MGSTPRHKLFYPAENDSNDYPLRMQYLAGDADRMAVDSQKLLSDRPPAGEEGAYYWATDKQGLHRDDGAKWQTIIQGWDDYVPVVSTNYQGSTPGSTPAIVNGLYRARYKLELGICHVYFRARVQLVPNTGPGPSYNVTLLAPAKFEGAAGAANVQNGAGHVLTAPNDAPGSQNFIMVQMLNNAHTSLIADGFGRYDSFSLTYEI